MSDPMSLEAEGDRALRTGLFRWSRDNVLAAVKYGQAAELFKAAGRYERAIAVYEKLIGVGAALKDNWAVGRAYEGLIDSSFLRDHEQLDVARTLELCDAAVGSFALESALNSFLTLMEKLARLTQQALRARGQARGVPRHPRAPLPLPLPVRGDGLPQGVLLRLPARAAPRGQVRRVRRAAREGDRLSRGERGRAQGRPLGLRPRPAAGLLPGRRRQLAAVVRAP